MVKNIAVLPVILLAALISLGAKSEDLNKNKKASTSISSTAPAKKTETEQVSQEAGPIMENILIAMKEQKYETYIRYFNATMRAAYTKKVFNKNNKFLRSRLGTYSYSSAQLRKIEKMNQHYILFYHAVFSRVPAPVIIRLTLERVDKKLQVALLSFNSPELQEPAPKKKWWWPFSWFS